MLISGLISFSHRKLRSKEEAANSSYSLVFADCKLFSAGYVWMDSFFMVLNVRNWPTSLGISHLFKSSKSLLV